MSMVVLDLFEALAEVRKGYRFKHRDATLAAVEQKINFGIHQMWQAQKKAVLIRLEQDRNTFTEADLDPHDAGQSYDAAIENASQAFHATFESALDPAFVGGMHATLADMEDPANLPPQFQLKNDAATQYSKEHAAALVSQVNETTRGQLRNLLAKARANGDSYTKTANDINATFDGFSGASGLRHIRDRATLVATTESAFAYENGSHHAIMTLKGYGLEYDKSWSTAGTPCETICEPNSHQGWISTNQSFQSGDTVPPGHPGCRCSAMYQRAEPKLTPEEHDAVDRYLGHEGDALEAKMRKGYPLSRKEAAHVRSLNSALSKSKLPGKVVGERLVSGLSCDNLKGKSVLDRSFGLLHLGHLLESESNVIELLLQEAPSDADIFSAINAGAHSIAMFQSHLGISDADLVSSGLRAKLRKLAKAGKLTAWGKGGAVHYTFPGAAAPVHGAVVKKAEVEVPAGSNGIKKGDKVILPHGTTFTPTSCSQDNVTFRAKVPEVKAVPEVMQMQAPSEDTADEQAFNLTKGKQSGKSMSYLKDLFSDNFGGIMDSEEALKLLKLKFVTKEEFEDYYGPIYQQFYPPELKSKPLRPGETPGLYKPGDVIHEPGDAGSPSFHYTVKAYDPFSDTYTIVTAQGSEFTKQDLKGYEKFTSAPSEHYKGWKVGDNVTTGYAGDMEPSYKITAINTDGTVDMQALATGQVFKNVAKVTQSSYEKTSIPPKNAFEPAEPEHPLGWKEGDLVIGGTGVKYQISAIHPDGSVDMIAATGKNAGKLYPDVTPSVQKIYKKTSGDTVAYSPPTPPVPKPIIHTTAPSVTMPTEKELATFVKVSGPLGSQGGQWYENPTNGEKWFVKPVKSPGHGYNELAANLAYRVAGVNVAPLGKFGTLGEPKLITKEIPNLIKLSDPGSLSMFAPAQVAQAREAFGIDAVLGNWDVVGLANDNMLWDTVNKRIVRLDTGGAMKFRAMGGTKPNWNTTSVWSDWESLRDPQKNPQAAKIFGGMTDQEVAASLKLAKERLNPAEIFKTWVEAGIPVADASEMLAVINYRLRQIDGIVAKLTEPSVPLSQGEWGLKNIQKWKDSVVPSERKAIEAYTGSAYTHINEHVSGGSPSTSPTILSYVKHLDQLMNRSRTSEDMILNRGFSPSYGAAQRSGMTAEQWLKLKPGDVFHDKGYISTSASHGFGGMVRLKIRAPKGTRAIRASAFSVHSSENEVLLHRKTNFRVLKVTPGGGGYPGGIELEVEVILPPEEKT